MELCNYILLHHTSVCFQYKQMVQANDEDTKISKTTRKGKAARKTTSLRILASAIATTLFLLWFITGGLKYAKDSVRETTRKSTDVRIDAAAMLFVLLLLIIGLTIVADMALGLSNWLQQQEEINNYQGLSKMENEASKEIKTTCTVIARMFGTVISLFMLLWTIYTGIRLTTEPRRDSKYNNLALSIGVITIAIGLVYIIIGLAIAKELALDLSGRLQRNRKGNWHSMREQQLC